MRHTRTKGISLIETLVAIAIMSLVVLSATSLFRSLLLQEKRNRAITEVESQAALVLYDISQSVRNATAITAPTTGSSSSSVTLSIPGIPAQNPTVYSYSSRGVWVSYAGGQARRLSSDVVHVSSVAFQNITATGTKGALRVSLGFEYAATSSNSNLVYTTNRVTSITLR